MSEKLRTALFDCETDGLLHQLSTVHVICITEHESGKKWTYRGDRVEVGVRRLMEAEEVVGHNIIGFDIPAVQKVFPWFEVKGHITDTLVCSRLMFSHIKDGDFDLFHEKKLPGALIGSHGLEGWGHRLGMHKGDYKKDKEAEAKALGITDPDEIHFHVWGTWNQEMEDYCRNDVALTSILYNKILDEEYPDYPVELEHEVAALMIKQEANGFPCDKEKLYALVEEMTAISLEVEEECKEKFAGRYRPAKRDEDDNAAVTLPKRTLRYKSTARSSLTEGAEYTKVLWKEFNPGSRDMVSERLKEMGWIPTEFTDTGKPSVNDDVLREVARTIPIADHLADFFMVRKRLGQIATGKENWIDHITPEGKIHGYVNPCGAVTGRATHSYPNLGQVPSVNWSEEDEKGNKHILMGKEGGWGYECRDSFYAPEPFNLMGADLSGIELRCLAHYMHKYDDGEYARQLLEEDIHTVNQHAAGLATRDDAKTFIYATLYGAGGEKIGSIVAPGSSAEKQKRMGYKLKKRFLKNTPALRDLMDEIETDVERDGYLIGLDGRRLHIRHKHAALNTLLQSAGALISKKWITLFEQFMLEDGFVHSWDGDFAMMAWIHDEIQVAVLKERAAEAGRIAQESALAAGEFFEFTIPTSAEFKLGTTNQSWAETH